MSPISIAGSGTITGISAGGLPNDCITTADIAANAVTTAKLGSDEVSGLAKAWVNFNGQGAVPIGASFNVSSITDNGVGSYTVNFATALADAAYCVTMSSRSLDGMGGYGINSAPTTTSVGVNTRNGTNAQNDRLSVSVAIFR